MQTGLIQITTTADSAETAGRLRNLLLENRLAACVQVIGPMDSRYWWKGTLESAREWLLVAKTTEDLYPRAEAAIRKAHPYEIPEIVATPIVRGLDAYRSWIRDSVENS